MLSKVSAITGVDNSSLGISSNFNIEKVIIGFFVYVLKLENLDQDGNQIVDENGEPIYNWYVGETRNPFKRWDEHIDSVSFSERMEGEFPNIKNRSPGYDEEFLKKLYSIRSKMGPKAFNEKFIQRLAFGEESRIKGHKRNQHFLSFLKKEGASEILKTNGSVWASKHKPIAVHYLEEISSKYFDPDYVKDNNFGEITDKELYDEMLNRERELTIIFAERYGRENVRGSSWGSLRVKPPKVPDFEKSSPINPYDFIEPSERSEYSEYFKGITPQQNFPRTEGLNSIFRKYERDRASEIAERLSVYHPDIWESIKEKKVVPSNVVKIFPEVNQKIWNYILKIKFPKKTSESERATKAGRPDREDYLKYNRRSILTYLKNKEYGKPGLHLINYLKALSSKKISEISGIPERHIEGLKLKTLYERGPGSLGQIFEQEYPQELAPPEEDVIMLKSEPNSSNIFRESGRFYDIKRLFKVASTRHIAAINYGDSNMFDIKEESMFRRRINDLNKFLKNSGLDVFAKEISFLGDKFAAGKPLPLNEASIDQVVQELIDGLAAKFLAYGIAPLDVLSTVFQSGGRVPSNVIGALYSTASTNKLSVGGRSINILYVLKFSFDPGDIASSETHPLDKDRRKIEITLGPNPPFLSEVAKYLEDSGKSMNVQNFIEQIMMLSSMAKPFIERAIYHEETHSLDVIGDQREAETIYKVEQPGESIGRILQKLNINFLTFIIDNQHIFSPKFSKLDYNAVHDALKKKIMLGDERDFNKIESDTKKYILSAGTPIVLLSRAGSQVVLSEPRSLSDISKSHGIDPERLFLLNFNKLNDSNEPYEVIHSAPDSYKKKLLSEVLPKDYEVVFTPSYRDLYRNYYDFYLLTREESVAHFNQIRKEIQNELKRLSEPQIKDLDFYKFLKLTNTVDLYLEAIKVKPFDKYIKTPFDGKTMDIIKKQRSKDFYNRMYWLWSDMVEKNEQI